MNYALTLSKRGTALVLGGSGGAGEAISHALAQAGASIALTYLSNEAKAQRLVAEIVEAGGNASAHKIDLREPEAAADEIGQIAALYGGIHTLVYAVGPIFSWAPIGNISPKELREVLAIETAGFHAGVFAALPFLRQAQGSIVACTTWANRRMFPCDGLSAVPKAAIESMVRQLALEEAENMVRANIVSLGSIAIGMGSSENERSMVKDITPEQYEQMLRKIPLGKRLGRGEELASAVLYLASDQASYVTGQTIIVDGGLSL